MKKNKILLSIIINIALVLIACNEVNVTSVDKIS